MKFIGFVADSLKKVRLARNWLESLGLDTEGSYFAKAESRLSRLNREVERQPDGDLSSLGPLDFFYTLGDAQSFDLIRREFSKAPSHQLPRSLLRKVLDCELVPTDEQPGTSNVNGRNHLFELRLAAEISRVGLQPIGFNDLNFCFEERDIYVQCKRLHSPNSVTVNIDRACEQLEHQLQKTNSRGLIALSMEKVLELDGKFLIADSHEEATAKIYSDLMNFFNENKRAWPKDTNPSIIGMIFSVSVLHWVAGSYGYSDYLPVCPLSEIQHHDSLVLQRLQQTLAALVL